MKKKLLKFLKNLPLIDLGTGSKRHLTKSKKIALGYAEKFFNQDNKKAIDLGCGDGFWSEKLKEIGYEITPVDAEKKYSEARIIDANQPLPFSNNTFDLCWCLEAMEHLDQPEEFIKEIKRILKPNGAFIITTPNSYFWLYSIAKFFGLTAKDLQRPDHKHFFHYNDIKKLFPDSKIFGYFPYTLLKFEIKNPWLVNHLSPTFIIINNFDLSMTKFK